MGERLPGFTCAAWGAYVDQGTLARALNLSPGPSGMGSDVYVLMLQSLGGTIQDLQRDMDKALEYLESLPDSAKREAAYQFFSSFFDQELPKKFLRQYVWGHGQPMVLSEQEMIDCNPSITVMRCKAFVAKLDELEGTTTPSTVALNNIACPAGALTNGTLGQFTVHMSGNLVYRSATDWNLTGKMNFYDEWDFDPKDFSTGGRSMQGELKTRFAHYTLPGDGFKITSVDSNFSQSAKDSNVVWKGGTPSNQPDRVAQFDIAVKNLE